MLDSIREQVQQLISVYGGPEGIARSVHATPAEIEAIASGAALEISELKIERLRELVCRWDELGDTSPAWLAVQVRALSGLTAAVVAEQAGISQLRLGQHERGASVMSTDSLLAVWKVYRAQPGMSWLTLDQLLEGSCAHLRALHSLESSAVQLLKPSQESKKVSKKK